ncbi:protein LURP-one-related 15-like [Andrographis paniculata]|uniref:protein LURP-one-related 15-like n=1 Tax=Andrographis paniculata TaxID=175694 RepID=UPI0021E71417|nr:protein LURP-one-related 15-like [Andrographis paniculata]
MENYGYSLGKHISVVSAEFRVPKNVHLRIAKRHSGATDDFVVTDEKGNIVFEVVGKFFSLHNRHVLVDDRGTSILTFKKKNLSAHKRWQAYNGDGSNNRDLLFSARTSSLIQFKTEVDIFLPTNKEETSWDFKVIGSWLEKSCTIYNKDSTPIAKMHKKHTFGCIFDKDTFEVAIYPNVDRAFIVTLVVIIHEMNKDY